MAFEPATNETDPLGVRGDFRATQLATCLNTPYIGPIPSSVEQVALGFLRREAEDLIAVPELLGRANEVRRKFAALFGADPLEVGFLSATSEGENLVTGAIGLHPGNNVVVDDLHYTTSYALYRTLERTKGIELRVVPSVNGRAGVAEFQRYVDSRTRLISVSWVSHQNGYRHPIRALADLAHAHGAFLYADGIQALGMFPTNLHDEGVDFVSSGTYKWLMASFGIAAFYIRQEHLDLVTPDRVGTFSVAEEQPGYQFRMHPGARKYEYATLAFGPLYQLDAGLDYLAGVGLDRIEAHGVALAAEMRSGLIDLGFAVRTPADNAASIVAFQHDKDAAAAREIFERRKVQVSFRDGGANIRAGAALFSNREDIGRFLNAAEELRDLPSLNGAAATESSSLRTNLDLSLNLDRDAKR